MKIEFSSLRVQEFKGIIEPMEVSFSSGVTVLHGPNRSGKTTILDAIYWVLFGKTLTGEARFGILPLDKQSGVPSVTLTLTVDGDVHTLTRKWVNNATVCVIDGAPKQLKEFNLWVEQNIMPVERFKVFSNPTHFASLPQKEQRDLFMRFFKKPSATEILAAMGADGVTLSAEYIERAQKNTAEEIIDIIKGKANVKGELDVLEKRQIADNAVADRLAQDIKEHPSQPAGELEAEREKILEELEGINKVVAKHRDAERARDEQYDGIRKELRMTQEHIETERRKLTRAREDAAAEKMAVCASLNAKIKSLRAEWQDIADQKNPDVCPTCNRPFPPEEVQAAKDAALKRQNEIVRKADKLKAESAATETEMNAIRNQPIDSEHLLALYATENELKDKLAALPPVTAPEGNAELYSNLRRRLDEITKALGNNEAFARNVSDLDAIKKRMEGTGREIQMLNRILQDAGQWIRYQAVITVRQVNEQFNHVKIELFDYLKDGTPKETFALTMDGKDYGDLSSTERIMVGLEINRYLKTALDVCVPCIIDNFESYQSIGIEGLTPQAIVAVATAEGDDIDTLTVEPYDMEG